MSTPENPSVNFFSLFRRGQHYAKTWPMEKRLAPMFIENRTIRATRYAIRFMPPIAVFTLCGQIALGGQLGPAVATALFALSLPMQGLWWLGKRSVTPLPPSILHWFYDVRGKLEEAGQAVFAAASAGEQGPAAGADAGAQSNDDVVDAEFTEVKDDKK